MSQTILVIEDNEQNLYLTRFLLTRAGYAVHSATSAREGIETASDLRPDGIILDIQLPEMDGYQVARHLREIPGLSSTPIIAVTSYAMVGDKEQALAAGCTGYLEKPINPETFTTDVARYLSPGEPR